jgi:hypothetical protein
MLTLTNPLSIEGFKVYRDDQSPTQFYVLPDQPAIALDQAGKPIFSLIVYRRDEDRIDPDKAPKEDVGGGILTFTVELGVPPPTFRKIYSELRTIVFGDDTADTSHDVQLTTVDFFDGTVSVAVAGEGTGDLADHQFVSSAVGSGKIAGVADNRKAVMVKLTQNGAALMSQIEKLRVLPINVQYSLQFEHRLMGVTLRVWCDVSSSYHLIQETYHEEHEEHSGIFGWSQDNVRTDKITSVTETLVSSKTAGVVVTPGTSQITQDTIESLSKFGEDMLSKELEKVVQAKPPPDSIDRTYLEKYFSDVSSDLNFSLDQKMVLVQNYTPSANISNIFQRNDIEQMVAFIDLRSAFFALLKIPVRVNADFSKLPLSQVVVTISYRSRRPDGTIEDRVESFDFLDGNSIQTFIAYANKLEDVAYDWTATVHYKDSQEPYVFRQTGVKDNFLVVDVGTLGMIAVDIGLGLVDLDRFPAATISLRYQSRALGHAVEQSFTLNKDKQSVVWTDIIREASSGSYEYKVDWLRKDDGSILPGQWTPSTSMRLRLDAPVGDHLSVSVVSTGNFKDGSDQIAHVAVSLRYADPGNDYTREGTLDFTDDKQVQTWSVDLRDPDLRDYQYRYTIVYKGGMVKNVPSDAASWLPGQPGFLVVGEKYGLEVNIYPTLLQFGDRDRMVQADLTYSDPDNNINTTNSFVFNRDQNKPAVWRVRTASPPGTLNYAVNITYFSITGDQVKLPTRISDGDALVIPPIPAAKAGLSATS